MQPRQWSLAPLISTWVGMALLMSACSFTLASNAASNTPVTSSQNPSEQISSEDVSFHTSDEASALSKELPPVFSAVTQETDSRQMSSSAKSDAPLLADTSSTPGQFPTLVPAGNFTEDHYRSGFACTGSMRPTIDCGDEGVFLKPPFQQPLELGDIISFSSDPSCRYYKNQNISKAHRIVSIRIEDGARYYTTKGDSTENPDLCETTADQIDGKLVEIRKGIRPLDIIDTSSYDLAKEWVKLLKGEYDRNKVEFDRRKNEYDARGEEYQSMVASYKDGGTEYETVLELYQQLEAERVALNLRKDHLNSLGKEINSAIAEVDRLYLELFLQ